MAASTNRAYRALIDWQINEGTEALVPCGTTGESPTLDHAEHKRVVEVCIEAAAGRVPVIAGSGSNSTAEAIELTQHAKNAGAAAALVVTPYYNKPTQEGLFRHYQAIAESVDLPIIIYNIPPRSVIDMSVETMARLAKLPNIIGVKDATADLTRPIRTRLAVGARTSASFPAKTERRCRFSPPADMAAFRSPPTSPRPDARTCSGPGVRGDLATTMAMQDKLMPLHAALFCESNPAPVKYAASLLGRCSPETRLPLAPLSEASKEIVAPADDRGRLDQLTGRGRAFAVTDKKREEGRKTVAQNRRARFDYIDPGHRRGRASSLSAPRSSRCGAAAPRSPNRTPATRAGELYLINAHIAPYESGKTFGHEPRRPRKLLLHRREIDKLTGAIRREGMTLVPLSIYFNHRGQAKIALGLAKGRRKADQRAAIKDRDWQRQKSRLLRTSR